ncbi:MAG: T9SS type A sorting domain-containing protein [Bacteroidota bacterium]
MDKLIPILLVIFVFDLKAQKEIRNFIFGHSLIHHEVQVNITPSQETSVPHWLHFLAEESGHQYAVSGQYGFLPQHANLPPLAQWGFDFVEAAWDSDNESFSEADFNAILITPGNFIQWQGPNENYFGDDISPIDATLDVFEWCNEQEEGLNFYIYENWPDMAPYLSNGFPPSETEWNAYLGYLNGDFHDWFLEYFNAVETSFPNSCVRMIPVGPLINNLMKEEPFNQIPIDELYEDDAPHGRASIYFLVSIVTYMAMYEENPPADYAVDEIIHPTIRDNYSIILSYFREQLDAFNDPQGNSQVFCNDIIAKTTPNEMASDELHVYPNPTHRYLYLDKINEHCMLNLYDLYGKLVFSQLLFRSEEQTVDLVNVENGIYQMVLYDLKNQILNSKRIIKFED